MRNLRFVVALGAAVTVAGLGAVAVPLAHAGQPRFKTSCWYSSMLCTELANPQDVWGNWYVGHDEPSLLFYSNTPGSGNQMTYQLQIPAEPTGRYSNRKSYNFELHPAFWFGMAMCDTQSYPETVRSCTPDSDRNIVDVRTSTRHPGTAFTELQFYPPGWVATQNGGISCSATQWCIALNIDSYSEDPINGTQLNTTCQSQVLGGVEYTNYAYLTLNGKPSGPPNPLQFNLNSATPPPNALYMNGGDFVTVNLHDSPHGLVTTVTDRSTGQTGFMTASAANGFGQIKFAPNGTECQEIPYDFHPMYSTSSPQTRVPWAAHSYNVAFSDEIGHFDYCTSINLTTGSCNGLEGAPGDQEPADQDDNFCSPASASLLYPVTGCIDANDPGFDGPSYLRDWPDGSRRHPTPILVSSPRTVGGTGYGQAAFETDLPRIEAADLGGTCDRKTGVGCSNPPQTDDGQPAFYPYYSAVSAGRSGCVWGLGSTLPNTVNGFGGSSTTEFGSLYPQYYYVDGGHGATHMVIDDYHRTLRYDPC